MKWYTRTLLTVVAACVISGCENRDIRQYDNIPSLKNLDARIEYIEENGKNVATEARIGEVDSTNKETFLSDLIAEKTKEGYDGAPYFNRIILTRHGQTSSAKDLTIENINKTIDSLTYCTSYKKLYFF